MGREREREMTETIHPKVLLTNRPCKENDVFKCKAQSTDSIADHYIYGIELLRWEWSTLKRVCALEKKVYVAV